MPDQLHAPWRMEYLRSIDKEDTGCFLCASAAAPPDQFKKHLVLWQTEHSLVCMNKFPYTSGHLMVAPRAHLGDMELLSDAQLQDIGQQTVKVLQLLKRAMSPQGFNIGINLGRAAGAGVPGHLHQHIVPRWAGDTNFITVVADIRVVPQAVEQLYDELMQALAATMKSER
ncbi:MAG: HIT domain-containing protein [Phycisphaerae bacterium]|nr:HIT domain-containing protein [Phycisphaerae bacterium]